MAEKELNTFELNPANWLGLLGAALTLLVSFGINITNDQLSAITKFAEAALLALVPIAMAWLTRRKVVPVAKVEAAVGEAQARNIASTTTKAASFLMVFVLGGSILVSSCAKLPSNTSAEAATGIRATQVVEGLRAAPPILKTITCTTLEQQKAERRTCVTPNESDFVAAQIQTAFEKAEELGRVLQVYDTTKDAAAQASLMAKAGLIAKAIQEAIGLAQIKPAYEEARQSVLRLFARVSELLLAFTPVVPAPA
jgi:hypothetical protein